MPDRFSLPLEEFLKKISYDDVLLCKELKQVYGGSLDRFIADMKDRAAARPYIPCINGKCKKDIGWASRVQAYNREYDLDLVEEILRLAKQ